MDMNPIMEQSGMKGFREDSSTGLLTLQPPTKKTPTMRPVLEKTKSASGETPARSLEEQSDELGT